MALSLELMPFSNAIKNEKAAELLTWLEKNKKDEEKDRGWTLKGQDLFRDM